MTDEPAEGQATVRSRRGRLITIAAIAALAGLTLVSTTQTWWTVVLATRSIAVSGTIAAPALSALSLSGLALAAALAIAGPFFRLILGVLQLLIGFTVVLTSVLSITAPEKGSEALISQSTGIAGSESVRALIKSIGFTPWPTVAIVLGGLTFLAGVYLLATFRRWPVASRKYQTVRFENASGERDAVVDWDALSEGEDPTAGGGER
jgi:hypothetical protein